ncbi:DUF1146 family protein [Streptococcus pluranimalium]
MEPFDFYRYFFHLLTHLVDWSKILKINQNNTSQVRFFVVLLSVILGYLASRFVLEIISLSQSFATLLN